MGVRYCNKCNKKMEPYGSLEYNSCQRSSCPASGRQICERCANVTKPSCSFCEETCSMCPIVHPKILIKGQKGYDSGLVARCECKDCPIYKLLAKKDRCMSCWNKEAEKLGCDVEETHQVFDLPKCGHKSCVAYQKAMDCEEGECARCKDLAKIKEEKQKQKLKAEQAEKRRKRELEHQENDIAIINKCLSDVKSSSAKSLLKGWIKKMDSNKKSKTAPN